MASGTFAITLALLVGSPLCEASFPAQVPAIPDSKVSELASTSPGSTLKGRFLHITDPHPDPFYEVYSATDAESACHRRRGPAGAYGAETSDCDSPFTLINATFDWINQNLKNSIDFVIWTGDSARHDNDEKIPRSVQQVLDQNKFVVDKMHEVFGNKGDHARNDFAIPVVPTIGNNDILPHNIFPRGPNKWTQNFIKLWRKLVPEEQRHSFERGGWFSVEVIPNRLTVFSLNTLYFFAPNAAVDGCASPSEPGYEHFEWLRIQLQLLRDQGMKAIISGHVPPARTEEKEMWDETCWQKYALWMRQYRDVVVGSVYGHMNIDHFMLQDFEDIGLNLLGGKPQQGRSPQPYGARDDEVKVLFSEPDYLKSLRSLWSRLPSASDALGGGSQKKKHKSKRDKYFKEIGGEWGERYSASFVSPSVVPNYFPTLRVFEYNITGLEKLDNEGLPFMAQRESSNLVSTTTSLTRKTRSKNRKPNFNVPDGPSKSAPPGPAYSPQSLSWLGYTQYFANLTYINNDFGEDVASSDASIGEGDRDMSLQKWKHGKNHGKEPNRIRPAPREFGYLVEYDTRHEQDVFGLQTGLTVRNMIELASRIGRAGKNTMDQAAKPSPECTENMETLKGKGRRHKRKKHHKNKRKRTNKPWLAFVNRALVNTVDPAELDDRFS